MSTQEISIINNGLCEKATITYDRNKCTLAILFSSGVEKNYADLDIYRCFGLLRKEFSHIRFLCKGSKINVYPSAMASQMSCGVVAYELTLGKSDGELVRIFDHEENDLTNDIEDQVNFRKRWSASLQHG